MIKSYAVIQYDEINSISQLSYTHYTHTHIHTHTHTHTAARRRREKTRSDDRLGIRVSTGHQLTYLCDIRQGPSKGWK